jgi:hypothetical protein
LNGGQDKREQRSERLRELPPDITKHDQNGQAREEDQLVKRRRTLLKKRWWGSIERSKWHGGSDQRNNFFVNE